MGPLAFVEPCACHGAPRCASAPPSTPPFHAPHAAQAQGTMAAVSGKVNVLHEGLEELHARLEKVEATTAQTDAAEPEYNIFESGIDA